MLLILTNMKECVHVGACFTLRSEEQSLVAGDQRAVDSNMFGMSMKIKMPCYIEGDSGKREKII